MKLFFILASFCISITAIAQNRDYLIKSNNDTIWGDIKLENKMFYVDGKNPLFVNPDDVVKVKGDRFKGSTVVHCKLLGYTDNLNDLYIDFIEKDMVDTVLVLNEIYSTPKINLYYVVNNYKTPFYFYKTPNDPRPVQLVIRYYLSGGLANYDNDRARYRGDKSKLMISEDKGYVNQLRAIMGDCKKIPDTMWELLSYRNYSLKQVIKKYNKCK